MQGRYGQACRVQNGLVEIEDTGKKKEWYQHLKLQWKREAWLTFTRQRSGGPETGTGSSIVRLASMLLELITYQPILKGCMQRRMLATQQGQNLAQANRSLNMEEEQMEAALKQKNKSCSKRTDHNIISSGCRRTLQYQQMTTVATRAVRSGPVWFFTLLKGEPRTGLVYFFFHLLWDRDRDR